jgi:hypothetical protein
MTPVTYDAAKQTLDKLIQKTAVTDEYPLVCKVEYDYIRTTHQIVIIGCSSEDLSNAFAYLGQSMHLNFPRRRPFLPFIRFGKGPVPITSRIISREDFYNSLKEAQR